jgi:DNA (cytosine-5)-methyltransferase 1
MLKVIELFAGIGSQHQALKNLHIEHEVVAISEIDKYAVQSYTALHGQPNNLGDITKIKELPKADLWTYSFPCQDISVAGKQAGIKEGTRSGLLWEVERLLLTARNNGTLPKYLLLENVKNLVGQRHKADFDKWLDFLNGLGYWSYWQVLNAKDYGIPQNRERVFAVSILGGGYYKFPKKQELKLRLKDMLEEKVDEKYYLSEKIIKGFKDKQIRKPGFKFEPRTEDDTACCLTARYYKMGISDNYIKEPQCEVIGSLDIPGRHESALRVHSVDGIAPACNTCGGGGLETKILQVDGLYLNDSADFHKDPLKDISRCLKAQQHDAGVMVIGNYMPSNHNASRTVDSRGLAPTVKENHGTVSGVMYEEPLQREGWHNKACEVLNTDGITTCIHTQSNNLLQKIKEPTSYRIRKLTPRECWRLMGWKDTEIDKVIACGVSNSQMYKQAGNGIVVNVLEAIFTNLFLKETKEHEVNQINFALTNQIKMEFWG